MLDDRQNSVLSGALETVDTCLLLRAKAEARPSHRHLVAADAKKANDKVVERHIGRIDPDGTKMSLGRTRELQEI